MTYPNKKQQGESTLARDAKGQVVQARPDGTIKLDLSGLAPGSKFTFWTANPATVEGAEPIPVTLRPGASGTIRLESWGPCGENGTGAIDEPVLACVEYLPPVKAVHKDGTTITNVTACHDRDAQIYVRTEVVPS